ncbi:interleukin-1 receptor-like 1 [Lampris incognitus]|uniref:interleukin-1 receptor-like 1 n=1 Tax=Lampris incognitus TaxID=2546036 RepID=UPI0024B49C78|nr:interleukin-1 receptor-like 1 [Lampris incognitus]
MAELTQDELDQYLDFVIFYYDSKQLQSDCGKNFVGACKELGLRKDKPQGECIPEFVKAEDQPGCLEDLESIAVLEGESWLFVHPFVINANFSDEEFSWYRNDSEIHYISSSEEERIHHHGPVLFLLNLTLDDSSLYTTRWDTPSGRYYNLCINVSVFPANNPWDPELLYFEIKIPDENPGILCPDGVSLICNDMKGEITWYKNLTLLPGEHEKTLRLNGATKEDEAIYTCMCTWRHNNHTYNSTVSRWLRLEEPSSHQPPHIFYPIHNVHIADQGSNTKLNCSVFCGVNADGTCSVQWLMNGQEIFKEDGYNVNVSSVTDNKSRQTISTAVLTIEKVSAQDFKAKFKCIIYSSHPTLEFELTLEQRATMTPHIIKGVCVVLLCLLLAATIKYFTVDLALLFRQLLSSSHHHDDGKEYDAYVIYQAQRGNMAMEKTLSHFVIDILPSVLEKTCGFRLFIHDRDELPGEDRLELVEMRMRLSRRLMVILTAGPEPGSDDTEQYKASPKHLVVGGYDWQVGLHQALIQREMSVILIQLEDMGPQGYTHLPVGLQHLVRTIAPLRWREGSRGAAASNSRFWKRVRYMMPVTPSKNKCSNLGS